MCVCVCVCVRVERERVVLFHDIYVHVYRKLAQGSSVDVQGRDRDASFATHGAEEEVLYMYRVSIFVVRE